MQVKKYTLLAVLFAFTIFLLLPAAAHAGLFSAQPPAPAVYYFISDLHIGGDGALNRCHFEKELIEFLRKIENGPRPAELVIVGDAFGLWELSDPAGNEKLRYIAQTHPALFAQLRETGKKVKITLLPGNHDYDLACWNGYKAELAEYNINLERGTHIMRDIAGRKIWIEHGNQHDEFNTFPEYGDRYGMPAGYFITSSTVTLAGRNADRGRSVWLNDLQSVYPNEEIPFWIWSNYFYKEMTPILRWLLLPFLLLFTFSVIVFIGRLLEKFRILRTKIFSVNFAKRFGFPGRLIDWVIWVNSIVISFVLILSIPLFLLSKDIQGALRRYGVDTSDDLKIQKENRYLDAAKKVFEKDSSVAVFIYGHTHNPSMRKIGERYVLNTGTWLKRLDRVKGHFRLLPDVYYPSYHLNYFTISQLGSGIRIGYDVIPKARPNDLTFLEKLVIYGKKKPTEPTIPAETIIIPTAP
jgi:UDP-2,3-diacylglucosamine pyrophosphatase LpxH